MALSDMARHNFHMGVEYMDSFRDDADTKDVVEALRVLSEFFTYNKLELGEGVDQFNDILASKAIDVAYTACSGGCTEYGLDLQDCIEELRKELAYHN